VSDCLSITAAPATAAACTLSLHDALPISFGLRTEEELLMGATAIRIYALCVLPSGINMVMTYYYQALEKEFISYLLFTQGVDAEDRKSTRLNSSHVSSSYAVFCLKKKTDGERSSARSAGAVEERAAHAL